MKNLLSHFFSELLPDFSNHSTVSVPSNNSTFSYIVRYSGGAIQSEQLPMLIALHGDGDNAENFYETALNELSVSARIVVFEAPISHPSGLVWPYSVEQYAEYGEVFSELVIQLANQYPTINKPVLFGFSGGGAMAYYQAINHGDIYSDVFAISGLLANEKLGDNAAKSGANVYAYHGKSDEVIPFSEAKKTVRLLKKKKVNVSFISFDNGHHGLFTDMKSEITQAVETSLNRL